jgi:acetaldehyde dehydrogenase/alcohol dehydrogenase
LTLGCGSYGHNSVGGNVSAINLLNIKKVGKRRNTMQWFKVPQKIYFERNSIQYLRSCKEVGKVFIVTDHSMVELGFLNKIIDELNQRRTPVTYQLFAEVEPDPDITTVQKGVAIMESFQTRYHHRPRRRLQHGRRQRHVDLLRASGSQLR